MVVGAFVYPRDDAHLRHPTADAADLHRRERRARASRRGRPQAAGAPIFSVRGAAGDRERLTQRRNCLAVGEERASDVDVAG